MFNTIFHPEHRYIAIGEDHVGGHGFNFSDPSHVSSLQNMSKIKNKIIPIWFEGARSRSFDNFSRELRQFSNANNLNLNLKEKSWEHDLVIPSDVSYSNFILGPDVSWVRNALGSHLNGKQTLLDAIVKSGRFHDSRTASPTKNDIIKALSDGSKPSEILELMMKEGSATNETVNQIYTNLRDRYYEGNSGALTGSQIYKRITSFNTIRQKHMAKKMKDFGGIFLAGDSHIPLLRNHL